MKIFLQEFGHHYKRYLFAYTLHALREPEDQFNDLFAKGFLPYTGETLVKNTYYMARSCRIELKKFVLSSENRRIQRKILPGTFIKSIHSPQDLINNDHFIKFCLDYFITRHGEDIFSKERLQFVLSFSNEVHIIKYANVLGEAMAYVIESRGKDAGQYWFSFYDLNAGFSSLGSWLMLDCIITAKENGLMYYYLGTVYGEKALYKTNFNMLEYWDGNKWVENTTELKKLMRSDTEREISA